MTKKFEPLAAPRRHRPLAVAGTDGRRRFGRDGGEWHGAGAGAGRGNRGRRIRRLPRTSTNLVGPIALYPDDLVAIILPASTNPLQIVQADRFLEKRKTDPKAPA